MSDAGRRILLPTVPLLAAVALLAGRRAVGAERGAAVVLAAAAVVLSLVLLWRTLRGAADAGSAAGSHERAATPLAEPEVVRGPVRSAEYAALLAEASAVVMERLDELRMPLHILREQPFGALNEHQEELVADAQRAADRAAAALQRLHTIAEVDQGALTLTLQPVRIGELLATLVPPLEALAQREGVRLAVDLAPGLPPVAADRARLRDALQLILSEALRYATPGTSVTVSGETGNGAVRLLIVHDVHPGGSSDLVLAGRLLAAQGGTVADDGRGTTVRLPIFGARSASGAPASTAGGRDVQG